MSQPQTTRPFQPECFDNAPVDALLEPRERHILRLHYRGTAYCGTQFQIGTDGLPLPTVQHVLQQALAQLGLGAVTVNFCSRTDAGVHSLGQVAHFETASGALANVADLPRALNAVLPEDVSVVAAACHVGVGFHSRRSARRKWYRYSVYHHRRRSALLPPNVSWAPYGLNMETLNEAANALQGVHNFKSFKCPNTNVTDDVCHIDYARWWPQTPHLLHFDVVADRFLYKMVRNLVGLQLMVGRTANPLRLGNGTPSGTVFEAIAMQDREALGKLCPTARAEGLTLMAVDYLDDAGAVEGIGKIASHPSLDVQSFFNDDVHLQDFPVQQVFPEGSFNFSDGVSSACLASPPTLTNL